MMKVKLRGDDGQEHVLLGLSRENVNRLIAGQPIVIRDMDWEQVAQVVIMFGETEQVMYDEIKKHVGIPKDVHIDPKLRGFKP